MRVILAALMGLAVVGCAGGPAPENGAGEPVRCDAEATRPDLVGSHVGAVLFPPGAEVRLVCTTCPMTRDYRPNRLNLIYDEATGIIQDVTCG